MLIKTLTVYSHAFNNANWHFPVPMLSSKYLAIFIKIKWTQISYFWRFVLIYLLWEAMTQLQRKVFALLCTSKRSRWPNNLLIGDPLNNHVLATHWNTIQLWKEQRHHFCSVETVVQGILLSNKSKIQKSLYK